MTPFDRWLIADGLLLVAIAAIIWWQQQQKGEALKLWRFATPRLAPATICVAGALLLSGDVLHVYA